MKRRILVICLLLIISGCDDMSRTADRPEKEIPVELEKPVQPAMSMPDEMPEDFQFSVHFGVNLNNAFDTYQGTVTKDLIENGVAHAKLSLTTKELTQVYDEMNSIHVFAQKKFIPPKTNDTVCVQDPHEDEEWSITVNGETITHHISGAFCEPTEDAKQFRQLRDMIWAIIEKKEAYRKLPEAVGGYD